MTNTSSTKAVDFSEDLARKAELTARILQRGMHWDMDDRMARAKAADPTKSLSSFIIDDLIKSAGTEGARRSIAAFRRRLDGVVTLNDHGRITEVHNEERLAELLQYMVESVTEQFMDWYKPNSTSNADVEIKLHEHAAWQELYKVATGKRF